MAREPPRYRWHLHSSDCASNVVADRAGTIVFYHTALAHMASQNHSSNIRQAVLCGFSLTPAVLPAPTDRLEHVRRNDLWLDWAAEVRAAGAGVPSTPPPFDVERIGRAKF